ncbi:hypothetical protein [Nocardia sp. NPDC004860]|uniref:SLAC1 family transporter n=1 Tax=Nocardia sp. NPDC004860 TaxID=3154557 RepID=UPI0033BF1B4F
MLGAVTLALPVLSLGFYALIGAEVIRFRPGYNVRRWATVFPLGMTSVAALSTGAGLSLSWARTLGRELLVVAIVVWLLVAAELAATRRPGRTEPTQLTGASDP